MTRSFFWRIASGVPGVASGVRSGVTSGVMSGVSTVTSGRFGVDRSLSVPRRAPRLGFLSPSVPYLSPRVAPSADRVAPAGVSGTAARAAPYDGV